MSSRQKKIEGFTVAYQPEIIRSNQKDEQYQQHTYQQLLKGMEIFIPHLISYRTLTIYKSELKLFSSLLYFGFTTLANLKTLGEEFTGITQLNENDFYDDGVLTTRNRKIVLVLLTTVFQYYLRKKTENRFNNYRDLTKANPLEYKRIIDSFIRNLPDFNGIIDKIFGFNLTLFFLQGYFLQISKKILGIKYVFAKSPSKHDIVYNKIGIILIIQQIIQFIQYLRRVYKDQQQIKFMLRKQEQALDDEESDSSDKQQYQQNHLSGNTGQRGRCGVCLEQRKFTTATPCGHLFCWECVLQYVNLKQECPQCRSQVLPQKLVQLRNYQ